MSNEAAAVSEQGSDNQGLTPKLRFPEFRDAGEWKQQELSALLNEKKEKNRQLKYGPEHVLSVSGEHGCVNQIELMGRSYAGASVKEYSVVKTGDIVYTKSPLKACPNGIIKANKGAAGIVSVLYAVYRPTAAATAEFIDYFFSSEHKLNTYLQPLVKKGPKNSILVKNSDVLKGCIGAPEVAEQRKIAECLSSLDALIASEMDKLATLLDHKRGMLQQLFPAEGETIPCLRFPEFCDAGEWEEVPLAKFIEEFREKSTVQDEFEVLTSARSGLVRQREYYDNDRITERDNVDFNIVPPGYITYRSRSDDRKFYFNENDLKITGIVSIYYPVFRILNGSNKFFIELLSAFSRVVGKFSVGTSQTVLSLNQLGRVRLPVPGELEQRRIAAFLSSLDSLINAQSDKVDALKVHKSGLMQQLFLSSTGATA